MSVDKHKVFLSNVKVFCVHFNCLFASYSSALYDTYLTFLEKYQQQGSRDEFNHFSTRLSLLEIVTLLDKKYQFNKSKSELEKEFLQILDSQQQTLEIANGVKDLFSYCSEIGLKIIIFNPFHESFAKDFLKSHHLEKFCENLYPCQNPSELKEIVEKLKKEGGEVIAIDDTSERIQHYVGMQIPTIKLTHGDESVAYQWTILLNDWPEVLYLFQSRQTI